MITFSTRLPPLIRLSPIDRSTEGIASIGELSVTEVERLLAAQDGLFTGLTPWYVSLTMVSVVASAMATWGASRRRWPEPLGTWMLVALSLFAGSQLHSLFFPAMYTSILTTTSFLRLGAVLAIIIGGVLVLRHVIDERTRLLETEQERIRQLEDLAALKADFTRIVAHELATPVAAINTMSDMIAIDDIPTDLRKTTARRIQAEARLLNVLITDVRDSADIERDTFRIDARRVALDALIDEAVSYAQTLPGDHPLSIEHTAHTHVLADPDRIGQVLRNLLSNAARYTPAGTPITIRTVRRDGSVTVEVVDSGPGIAPRDQELIFEKFGRGTRALHSRAGGSGLGLYLSRHILHSHHSDLTVDSLPGQGATFRFTLEEMS